ncbi:hypothetical protein DACRYDRAFT_30212, partial [Dacryopinax primogenitus]
IYGSENVTLMFHWLMHMPDQIWLFSTLNGFWTFLFKRLNKILKSIETNGHKHGMLEITFAHEF